MTSKRADPPYEIQSSESDGALDRYEFVPIHLRHDFKVRHQGEQDNQESRQLVRHARQARSAHLVTDSFANPSPAPPTQLLYSNAIERAITARMTFARAQDTLEKYLLEVLTKVKELETRDPNTTFDASDVKIPSLVQTQSQIINVCQSCLSDCDLYLGMYEPLPSPPAASSTPIVKFAACSAKSLMLHQVLECPLPIEQNYEDEPADNQFNEKKAPICITMQAMSAQEALIVDNIADLQPGEIHRFSPSKTLAGPFACFPLLNEETDTSWRHVPIGVLSVDSCRKAQRLLPQSMSVEALSAFLTRMHLKDAAQELSKAKMNGVQFLELTELDLRHKPLFKHLKVTTRSALLDIIRALQRGSRIHLPGTSERAPQFFTEDDDALEFLSSISKLSGNFLANYRRVHWIREIANVSSNPACTAYDVYDVLIRAITRFVEPLERVALWKITKKKVVSTSASTNASSPWEIDVVASTALPDDRALPFIDGQERKIKRIALYKENEAGIRSSMQADSRESGVHTPLIRGGIINIISKSTTLENSSTRVRAFENATYHLSWSDRSLQFVSWPQLRQLLPIRNMNSKHFQLQQLCHRLQEAEAERQRKNEGAAQIIKINNPNGLVLMMQDSSRPKAEKYALEVDFSARFEPPQPIYDFLQRTVSVANEALKCVRGREARYAKRRQVVAKSSQRFQSIGLNPSGDALRALQDIVTGIFEDITDNLPGVHVQIAELQADGVHLKYTFAGTGSTALGCSLNRGQGISFQCLDTKQPIVVEPTSDLRSRLQRVGVLRNQPQLLDISYPFVFVPLFHEDCAVGVLSVDTFHAVPKGRHDEAHPESGVVAFLASLGKLLASVIYAKRRSFALHQLQISCQEPLRSPQQLLFYACRALKDIMVGAWKVRVVEIDGVVGKTSLVYEFSETEREQSRSWVFNVVRPMAFRWKELCTESIVAYVNQLQPEQQATDWAMKLLAAIREEEDEHQRVVDRYNQLVAEEQTTSANAPRMAAMEAEKAKLVERQIADKYFLLLNEEEQSSLTGIEKNAQIAGIERIANARYISHAMKLFLGSSSCLYSDVPAMDRPTAKLFLTISTVPQFHANCDHVYLQRVTSITSRYMTALQNRVRRSRERTLALGQFRALCQKALLGDDFGLTAGNTRGGRYQHQLSPATEVEMESLLELQRETIGLIERALRSPNVYFGMWEPALRILRYTSASKSSIMTGKKLIHGHGVSFRALEKQIPVVVTSQDAKSDDQSSVYFKRLRYFTNEPLENRKWPFIVVPIGNLGILALDNMDVYKKESNESQPEIGIVDFLRKIGQSFVEVLAATRERSFQQRKHLRDEALIRVMTACENFKPTAKISGTLSLYLPHLVIQQLENALNGVDAYIGVVDPLCERIRFICASSKSKMENKAVDTKESISFRAFGNQRTIVIPQLSQYFKQQELQQQHDRVYGQKLKYFGSAKYPQGPFVCVPIPFVGVLSVDTFPGAAGGIYSPSFPEDGVVTFLERVANYLGENIRTLAATDARKLLPTLFLGNKTTFPLLFKEIITIISRNLLAVFQMQAIRFRRDEQTGQWQENTILAKMKSFESANHESNLTEEEQILLQRSLEDRFNQHKPEEENKAVFPAIYQLPKTPEVLVVHCSPTRGVDSDKAEILPTVIILRRVKGATWMYDEEFLLSILPLINSLIALVNTRVEGIVARRMATLKIQELCSSLEKLSSAEAVNAMYSTILPTALEILAQASSRDLCDAYIGQQESTDWTKSLDSHLQLRYAAASNRSLMKNVVVDLENSEHLSLTVVQCLQNQQSAVVPLSREKSPVRSLTSKPAQRVFIAVPVGNNCVLCADSLGQEAFVPGKKQTVEPDVVSFVKNCASILQEVVVSTRHRVSYDQIRSLTTSPHADMKLFFSTILSVLRRDLVRVHSQQIITLGPDFTSAFRLEAWHRSHSRRPITTLPVHFCSVNGCDQKSIEHEVHLETQVLLPMTNLPRTLDLSRSRIQPVEGVEKHGKFTCTCLATMLDASMVGSGGDAKLALCIYSHDAATNEIQGTTTRRTARRSAIPQDYGDSQFFSSYQRKYFFAFAAVVSDVYVQVFRACALETFASELFMILQEYLDAKDGIVVRFSKYVSTLQEYSGSSGLEPVVIFSQQPGKILPGRPLQGKLERKARQFAAANAPLTIFMTKKAIPAPPAKEPRKTGIAATFGLEKTKAKAKRSGLFGGRKFFRYGKKKKQDEEDEKAQELEQLRKATPELQALSPSRDQQLRQETVSFHVFFRALDYQGRSDIVIFKVEKQSIKGSSVVEKLVRQVKHQADLLTSKLISSPPRGDEEINAKRFCTVESGSQSGGGGFLLLATLEAARNKFELVEGSFGGAMRQFLTGAQGTARDSKSNANETLSALFGDGINKGDGATAESTPTTALLRVVLVACGAKRDIILALNPTDVLKEYLRMQAGRKLLQLDPTDRKVWPALARARTLLRSSDEANLDLGPRPEEEIQVTGAEQEANQALHTLLDLLLAQSAVVRYLKYLEMEIAREQRQLRDKPATTLQCFVRQSQARTELKKRRREFKAALAIQCAFRQHLAHRRILFMKWTKAAIKVQRAYRRKRQRAQGSRPRRFTAQLMSASQKNGRSPSLVANESVTDGAWRTDMAAFGSFQEFLDSKVGREQVKKEEELMWRHRRQLEKERAKLSRDEALREDVGDLFELLDEAGSGELSRERTSALITRLHVPLNEEEVDDVVAMMDSDGSGGISMDEFMRWFAHEFPLLQKRAPRVCGVVTRQDWQWVIQQSARSAILKRWRAMRNATAPGGFNEPRKVEGNVQDGTILEEVDENDDD